MSRGLIASFWRALPRAPAKWASRWTLVVVLTLVSLTLTACLYLEHRTDPRNVTVRSAGDPAIGALLEIAITTNGSLAYREGVTIESADAALT